MCINERWVYFIRAPFNKSLSLENIFYNRKNHLSEMQSLVRSDSDCQNQLGLCLHVFSSYIRGSAHYPRPPDYHPGEEWCGLRGTHHYFITHQRLGTIEGLAGGRRGCLILHQRKTDFISWKLYKKTRKKSAKPGRGVGNKLALGCTRCDPEK